MKPTYYLRNLLRSFPLFLLVQTTLVSATEADLKVLNAVGTDNTMVQQIELNPRIANTSVGKQINFALPNHGTLAFKVDSVKEAYQGSKVVSASSTNGVSLLLTMDEKASFGSIRGEGINYSISHSSELGQVLVDQNNESFPNIDLSNDDKIPPGMSADEPGYIQMGLSAKVNEPLAAKRNSIVTIMVLYSNEFANGFASPSARINQLIEFTNQAYIRSGINIQLKLAHAQALSFNNGTNIGTLLNQITNGSGSFSGVESLRNKYGADMVALLPFRSGGGSSGVAWVNGGSQRFSYSVTQLSPNCCDSVFAHELGHNLGSGHERVSANPNQGSPCNFNFVDHACGHGNASRNWGTIMSYLNSGRVNHVFSNPGLSCLGEPCGIREGQTNEADNNSAFNITGPLVAAFRADTPFTPPDPSSPASRSVMIPMLDILLDEEN